MNKHSGDIEKYIYSKFISMRLLPKPFRCRPLASCMRAFSRPFLLLGWLFIWTSSQAIAQDKIKISGTVKDRSQGQPMVGVTITEVGTRNIVVTDDMGRYAISVSNRNATLTFGSVGYAVYKTRVGDRKAINVELDQNASDLENVVVVGYGRVRKSDLTGSVSKIKTENAAQTPILSVDQYLQGRVAGAQITQNTGAPGSGLTFLIRGASSISGSNQPLIILDGYPIESENSSVTPTTGANNWTADMPRSNPLANLNPNDIESIEVLKDASSIAIYGSRGANGVVIITTKKGQAGRERINYSARFDVSNLRRKIDILNSADYLQFSNEANFNSGLDSAFTKLQIDSLQGINSNWQDLIYQQALSQDHQLSISGGTDKFKYLMGLNYTDAEGIVKNSRFQRGSFRLNMDRTVSDKLSFGTRMNAVLTRNQMATQSHSNGATSGSAVGGALFFRPFDAPFDPVSGDVNDLLEGNPLTLIENLRDHSRNLNLLVNLFADYKITNSLTFRVNAGVNNAQSTREVYMPRGTFIGNANNGLANRIEGNNYNYLTEYTLTYDKQFKGKHSLNAVAGYTWQAWNAKSVGITATNFPNDNLGYNNFQIASNPQVPVTTNVNWALASVLGRVNYVYDNRFLMTLTSRADGSSRLAQDNKWAFFPSVGLGWNVHNESFMKSQDFFSELKLRASYGFSGNQAIAVGSTQSRLRTIRRSFGGGFLTALTLNSFENQNLAWETTAQFNAGIDIGLAKGRFRLTMDFYNRLTSDLLLNLTLPGSTGFGSYAVNNGEVENRGFEIEIDTRLTQGKVKWNLSGNISFNTNKLLSLGNTGEILGPNYGQAGTLQMNAPVHVARPGLPIGSFLGYRISGIYQNQAEITAGPIDPVNPKPGDFKFTDVNGDGKIDLNDRTIIGNTYPRFVFGVTNDITWKQFNLNFLIAGNIGQDVVNLNRFQLDGNYAGFRQNVSKDAFDGRWTGEGSSNKYPRPTSSGLSFRQRFSDFIVEDASFIRLRTATLSYQFIVSKKSIFKTARLFASGINLLTVTKYSGYDPEINAKGESSLTPGVDFGSIPQVRSFSAGVNVGF